MENQIQTTSSQIQTFTRSTLYSGLLKAQFVGSDPGGRRPDDDIHQTGSMMSMCIRTHMRKNLTNHVSRL
jgi:hypothetical protein